MRINLVTRVLGNKNEAIDLSQRRRCDNGDRRPMSQGIWAALGVRKGTERDSTPLEGSASRTKAALLKPF